MTKIVLLMIRLGSGFYMLFQGYEKLTGGFAIDGLVPVIKENQDSPEWFKIFFDVIIANHLELFKWIVQLGEIAIGLGLILGVFSFTASFFGVFIMLNYILADMIFTYPIQLFFFIILLINKKTLKAISLKQFIKRKQLRKDVNDSHTYSG
ncbi:DoxX family protein [Staphylococcus gallinarum]|uniref:DoxX family membrane protein n=1 Tax=Staphylococcus gallinarum TaxID=1293 RepID=UPI001E424D69|nr:DoxX family protein [Staphylococcus gallinarum]MCD8899578.1 DoxX family protein [Staphylococcus gallinarum]